MDTTKHINPDHYLETEQGRLFTPERSAAAWELAYRDLDKALSVSSPATKLYVVVGVQAAGKSSWIQQNAAALGGDAVFFDAALPKTVHRERAIQIARSHGVPVVCIWLKADLQTALRRNTQRRADHQVPEQAIRSVFAMFEPPSEQERFTVVHIDDTEPAPGSSIQPMGPRQFPSLQDLDQQVIVGWRACEMALAEGGRWDMDESGRQHWVPGEAVWSHPQVPYLQFIEIWIQLVDGRVWSMLSRIDDGSGFHGLYLVTPEASESGPGVPASIGYRDRLLAELPLGLVRIKDMRRDADGFVVEMCMLIGQKVVRFLSGEVYERGQGLFEVIELDESILVQIES